MNLFGTVLTYTAPSANYRGESAQNRTVIQKITKGKFEYAIISPEAVRNALRETLRTMGLPLNRTRLHDEDQLAVKFEDYNYPEKYADDFFFGYLIAANGTDRKKIKDELKARKRDESKFTFKRDSVFRMNLALALEPYRHDTVFTQSPKDFTDKSVKSQVNSDSSALLHRETTVSAFQYPFALNLEDCSEHKDWARALLSAIGQLNNVSGNHARSYFEMAPASVALRLTKRLVAGYDTYGFRIKDDRHTLPEIVDGILNDDFPGAEFHLGGKVVKDFDDATANALVKKGVTLDRNAARLLDSVAEKALR
jgi:CRISPR-associated protein Cst2